MIRVIESDIYDKYDYKKEEEFYKISDEFVTEVMNVYNESKDKIVIEVLKILDKHLKINLSKLWNEDTKTFDKNPFGYYDDVIQEYGDIDSAINHVKKCIEYLGSSEGAVLNSISIALNKIKR